MPPAPYPPALNVLSLPYQLWPKWKQIIFEGAVSRVTTDSRHHPGDPGPYPPPPPDSNYSYSASYTLDRWEMIGPEFPDQAAFSAWGMTYSPLAFDGGLMTYGAVDYLTPPQGPLPIIMGLELRKVPELTPVDRMRGRPDGRQMQLIGHMTGFGSGNYTLEGGIPPNYSWVRMENEPAPLEFSLENLTTSPFAYSGGSSYTETHSDTLPAGLTGNYSSVITASLSITFQQ